MFVKCDFTNGHRFARLLGFECEAPLMRRHGPNDQDEALYAMVKS